MCHLSIASPPPPPPRLLAILPEIDRRRSLVAAAKADKRSRGLPPVLTRAELDAILPPEPTAPRPGRRRADSWLRPPAGRPLALVRAAASADTWEAVVRLPNGRLWYGGRHPTSEAARAAERRALERYDLANRSRPS